MKSRDSHPEAPRADDGTPLSIKEGIVLDREGTPLVEPEISPQIRVFTLGGFLGPLGLILIPVILTLGFAFFAVFLGALLLFWLIFKIFRIVSGPSRIR